MADHHEALSDRYILDFTNMLDGGKAAVITDTVTQCGLYLYSDRDSLAFSMVNQQAERIAKLELQPAFAELASNLAVKLAATEAERDTLRAEVERLKPNAERYEWLCEKLGETQLPTLIERITQGYVADYKPSIDAAIDTARKATP